MGRLPASLFKVIKQHVGADVGIHFDHNSCVSGIVRMERIPRVFRQTADVSSPGRSDLSRREVGDLGLREMYPRPSGQ